jgi:hypothetical protein
MEFDTPNMIDQFILAVFSLGHWAWALDIRYWTWWK